MLDRETNELFTRAWKSIREAYQALEALRPAGGFSYQTPPQPVTPPVPVWCEHLVWKVDHWKFKAWPDQWLIISDEWDRCPMKDCGKPRPGDGGNCI